MEDISRLRGEIDAIDRRLVEFLVARADVAAAIGRLKAAGGSVVFDPGREEAVILRAVEEAAGRLPRHSVEAIFREIISASRALEAPTRVVFLGSEGGFTHEAASQRFGGSAFCEPVADQDGLLAALQNRTADFGCFPFTPSGEDPGFEAFDLLLNSPFPVAGEFQLEGAHVLLRSGEGPVARLYGDPFAFTHCRRHLDQAHPKAERVAVQNSLEAARMAARMPGSAALGPRFLAELAGLVVSGEGLDDAPSAARRYLILASQGARRAQAEKTALLLALANRPGVLHSMLGCFASAGINVVAVENRANARWSWEHLFYLEAEGHHAEPAMAGSLKEVERGTTFFKVLGSFPKGLAR